MRKQKTVLDFFTKSSTTESPSGEAAKSNVDAKLTQTPSSSKPSSKRCTARNRANNLSNSPLVMSPSTSSYEKSICSGINSSIPDVSESTPSISTRAKSKFSSGVTSSRSDISESTPSTSTHAKSKFSSGVTSHKCNMAESTKRQSKKNALLLKGKRIKKSDTDDTEEDKEKSPLKEIKRRRIVVASESEDSDEYRPEKDEESSDSSTELSDNDSKAESPLKKKRKTRESVVSSLQIFMNPKVSPSGAASNTPLKSTKMRPTLCFASNSETPASKQNPHRTSNYGDDFKQLNEDSNKFYHEKLKFLMPLYIRDDDYRDSSHPLYNPSTLDVDPSFLKKQTPAMRQWWRIKAVHFDAVLFFKVGKFYELYHMDAVIGVKELGLSYMKGDFAHAGFPENSFGRFSDCLVEKGYKVVRVEQTETPQMLEERNRKCHLYKNDKVVSREICQITTKGTRTFTYQDVNAGFRNNFLIAIYEKLLKNDEKSSEYGVCFVDTSIGKFMLGQFKDDRHKSNLLTLIALYPPVEVLYDRTSITKATLKLFDHHLTGATKKIIRYDLWDSRRVLRNLQKTEIFTQEDDTIKYPETFMEFLDPCDKDFETPLKKYEFAIRSLGAIFWYLQECCIEDSLLSLKLFEMYDPVGDFQNQSIKNEVLVSVKGEIPVSAKDEIPLSAKGEIPVSIKNEFPVSVKDEFPLSVKDEVPVSVKDEYQLEKFFTKNFKKHMILDGVTLQHLEIVPSLSSGNPEGTLFGTMDYCSTNFGKRLFRIWLCSPLCDPDLISNRLDAIDDLTQIPEVVEAAVACLKKIPDLERLMSKIHTYGFARSKFHPESQAIYYEKEIYNKKKINDFLSTLEGFKEILNVIHIFKPHLSDFKSTVLKQCISSDYFPDITNELIYFEGAFDHEAAKKQGNIIPSHGVDIQYDVATSEITKIENEFEIFLEEQKRVLNCKVSYVGTGKNRYTLEVPENKKVPTEYVFQGGKKGFKRYFTKETKDRLERLIYNEEKRASSLQNITKRIFAHFDQNYSMWKSAIQCISILDVLISLVLYCKASEVPMCRPKFFIPNENVEPFLEIIGGQHPTFLKYFTGNDYIPNSVYIGPKRETKNEDVNSGGKLVLVTGPNMGGKSTLMRQAGALLIMAHLGSYVPAESMSLTPVDRIFTRVGASDQICKGESTFFVEASETSCILRHATSNSFVLVDELGRGTATYDGTAIAYAALHYLANDIRCRTLFSTHYHSLVEDFCEHPSVGLGHMACLVEKGCDCPALEKITFLYKFIDGACPKSYGFNVALLAGIDKSIVRHGFLKAQQMEYASRLSKLLRRLLSVMKPEEITKELKNKFKLF